MASIETPRKLSRRPPPLLRSATIHEASPVIIPSKSLTINVPGGNSPRVSWEESLNDLSRGLQLICGSPPSAGPMSPRRPNHPLSSPGPFAFGDPAITSNPRKKTLRNHTGELRRADSVQVRGSRHPPQRTIFVRHIETHAELQNRLEEICCTGATPDGAAQRTGSPRASALEQARQFTLTRGAHDPCSFRIRVNAAPFSVEELIVSVRDRRRLTVGTISISGKILSESTLTNEASAKNLVGQLEDDGVLLIRERPDNMADCVFCGTGSAFVPVERHDESKRELTIVVHVPREFRYEDLSVQTVDDHVIVVGKKRTTSLPQVVAFNFRSNGSVLPSFRVMLQLPSGTDSRSICALLTRHHQLIIRGKLGPTSRRYTF